MECGIKFRPIKPRLPHLNGRVERFQRTDLEEFYHTVDVGSINLHDLLQHWQHYYSWERPPSSLCGKKPIDNWSERLEKISLQEGVEVDFNSSRERIRDTN